MCKTATLVYKFYTVVLLAILDHSILSAALPTVPGVVTLIVSSLQFLCPTIQSTRQSNILAIVLLLMLLLDLE